MDNKINLLNFSRTMLRTWCEAQKLPAFRADQLIQWIHQKRVVDFNEMTNLSKSLREQLQTQAHISLPKVVYDAKSADGTHKFVLELAGGNCIETVFIPERERGTLCVSSQVGCGLNCSFCSTARQGFNRDLSIGEIIGQVWIACQYGLHVTNVVMMGMGEPLLNFENVVNAMDLMLDDLAYGLSKRRVTLSTSGLIPQMEMLKARSPVALAVSLHAPTDPLRDQLVPLNKKYPVKALMAVCRDYFENEPRRVVTFEYVMLKDVNDSDADARALVKLLADVPSKVNLIPFNTFPGAPYTCSTEERIDAFRELLIQAGINAITRKTRGDDIDAACGQLVGKVEDRTSRSRLMRARDAEQTTANA